MPSIQKFYLHAAATGDTGTLPFSGQVVSPSESGSTGPQDNRAMDATIGTSQSSLPISISHLASGDTPVDRWVSAPLATQDIAAGSWTLSFAGSRTVGGTTNVRAFLGVWRPSSGSLFGTIFDITDGSANIASTAETLGSITYGSAAGVTGVLDGDILVLEIYASSLVTDTTFTFYYDGTTESSTTSEASNLNAPAALPMSTG